MRSNSKIVAALAALALVGAVAGCSSDSSGSGADSTASSTTVATPGSDITIAPGTSNKTVKSADFPESQGFTFPDTDAASIDTFIATLDKAPTIAAQPGTVSGVDVTDSSGAALAQIFVYTPDAVLNGAATAELLPLVTQGAATTPGSYGVLAGLNYTVDGKFYFVGSNDADVPSLYMLAVADSAANLDNAIGAYTFAVAQ
jgi:hypothetical protein